MKKIMTLALITVLISIVVPAIGRDDKSAKPGAPDQYNKVQQIKNQRRQDARNRFTGHSQAQAKILQNLEKQIQQKRNEHMGLINKLRDAMETARKEGASKTVSMLNDIINERSAVMNDEVGKLEERRNEIKERIQRRLKQQADISQKNERQN